MCIRKGKKKRRVNLKPITVWCILSLNKIKTKLNELSSSSTVTFPLPILHLLQPSFTLPPFLFFPATACLSPNLPHLVFHFKPTTLPPSSSLSIQNNSHSRKRAINLLQWDQSARECQGYSRLLSLLTSTQHWITYRRRERANGESGRVREGRERVKETILDRRWTLDLKSLGKNKKNPTFTPVTSRGLSRKDTQQLKLKPLILSGNSKLDPWFTSTDSSAYGETWDTGLLLDWTWIILCIQNRVTNSESKCVLLL